MQQFESLWGDATEFVKHFSVTLADMLLKSQDWNTKSETEQLEQLEKCFGKTEFGQCRVMLNDMKVSLSLRDSIQPRRGVRTTIISHVYWPESMTSDPNNIPTDDLFSPQCQSFYPRDVLERLQAYSVGYNRRFPNRKLSYLRLSGIVTVDVDIPKEKGGFTTETMQVTPVDASVLYSFTERGFWKEDELATKIQAPVKLVKESLSMWCEKGVLREVKQDTDNHYEVIPIVEVPIVSQLTDGTQEYMIEKEMMERAQKSVITTQEYERVRGIVLSFMGQIGRPYPVSLLRQTVVEDGETTVECVDFVLKMLIETHVVGVDGSYVYLIDSTRNVRASLLDDDDVFDDYDENM